MNSKYFSIKMLIVLGFAFLLTNKEFLFSAMDYKTLSAEEIAQKLIDANSGVDNLQGKFTKTISTKIIKEDFDRAVAAYKKMIKDATSEMEKRDIELEMQFFIDDVKSDGYQQGLPVSYEGVMKSNKEFNFQRTPIRNGEPDSKFTENIVSNGEKGMTYTPLNKTMLIEWTNKPSSISIESKGFFKLKTWMHTINQIGSTDKVEILEWTKHNGLDAVVIKQAPTDFTLNAFETITTVVPSYGFSSVRTEFRNPSSNKTIKTIECDGFIEVHDGKWRPQHYRQIYYTSDGNSGERIDYIESIDFETEPSVNVDLPKDIFALKPNGEIRYIKDKTIGENGSTISEIELPEQEEIVFETGSQVVEKMFIDEPEEELKQKTSGNVPIAETNTLVQTTKQPTDPIGRTNKFDGTLKYIIIFAIAIVLVLYFFYRKAIASKARTKE